MKILLFNKFQVEKKNETHKNETHKNDTHKN